MAINTVVAGSGLAGGGSTSTVTLSIANGGIINSMLAADSVLDSNIASGQVVKTFNGLTDAVVLAAGQNVTLTPVGNTVTVSSPTTINVALPLVLTTSDYGATIEGHIAITPVNDGGAAALQTGTPVFQTGFVALDNVYIPNTGQVVIGATSGAGLLHIKNTTGQEQVYLRFVNGANSTIFQVNEADIVSAETVQINTSFILGDNAFVYGSALPEVSFNIPVDFHDTLTIYKNLIGATTSIPLFDLTPHSVAVPLVNYEADIANALIIKSTDDTAVVNTTLYSDGKFFSRQVRADNFIVGTHEQVAGAVTLGFTGVSFFACDASSAPITFTLPLIDVNSPSGYQYTFKKTDISTNQVMVSAQAGQPIDGVTDKIITTQWGSLKLVSVVSGSSGYWLSI